MAETRPTPGPWIKRQSGKMGTPEYCWKIYEDREFRQPRLLAKTTGGSVFHEDDASMITACRNAVQSLAEKIGADPVALAKKLEDGGLVELVRLLKDTRGCLSAFMLDTMHPERVMKHETIVALDAILARLGGEG